MGAPLYPNFVDAMNLEHYYNNCGDEFDFYIKLLIQVVFGTCFSGVLDGVLFGMLFTLPISLVRSLWLVLLMPEDPREDTLTVNKFAILCGLMRFVAIMIPLLTAFPLLF